MIHWRLKPVLLFYFVAMIVLQASILVEQRNRMLEGYGDFAAFYTAGKLLQQHRAASIYDHRAQWEIQQQFASGVKIRQGPLPYVRPPFEALLFAPFAGLNYAAAWALWTLLKIAALLAVPFLLPRDQLPWQSRAAAALLSLSFFPVGFDLILGQDSILFLVVIALAFRCLLRNQDFKAGCFLALGLFKFHLVLPLVLILALRKAGKVVLGFIVTGLMLVGISGWLVGWPVLIAYPAYLRDLSRATHVGFVTSEMMPNLRGLVTLMGGNGSSYLPYIIAATIVLGAVFAASRWKAAANPDSRTTAGFSLAIVITLLTAYYSYGYDLILLLIPILGFGRELVSRSHQLRVRLFRAGVAVALLTPLHWILVFRSGQYGWIALVLVPLAVALASMAGAGDLNSSPGVPATGPTGAVSSEGRD